MRGDKWCFATPSPKGSVKTAIADRENKGDEKWPLFVNKELFWWSASIKLDNNNAVLTDLYFIIGIFLTLYFTTYLSKPD